MSRHKAREAALKILYALEIGHQEVGEVLSQVKALSGADLQWGFTDELVRMVCKFMPEINACIEPYAKDWPLFRMAAIDRTILRIAVAEMLYFQDIPYEVTINEAVELAKKYGDVDSGNFVNGILSSIHRHRFMVSNQG